MANNRIQVKRTSTAGRTPNTTNSGNSQYIAAGEFALNMADGILYSSNGSAVIEVGANNTSARVTGTLTVNAISANGGVGTSGQVLKSNGTSTYWATDNADVGAANQILYRNSSNALTTSSGLQYDGTSIKVNGNLESVYQNGDEGGEIFLKAPAPANTSIAGTGVTIDIFQNKIRFFEQGGTNRGAYIDITSASAGVGSNLLAGGGGTVDVAAQYVWTNLHTFSANVSISANAIGLTTNTSAIYFAGTSDANWKMGRNTGAFTKWKYTNNSVDIAIANSNLEGFTIGNAINPGNSFFETGYLGTFIASNVTIGNSSVNASINSTAFTGTSNNSTNFNGQSASYYTNATNITTGTLPYAQIPANIANTTGAFTFSGVHTHSANIILGSSGLSANGGFGTAGQVLHSNGTATYWATDDNSGGTVTSISAGNGVISSTGGAITTTGTLYIDGANGVSVDASGVNVLAGTGGGLVSNSTGVFVTQGTGTVVNATGVHVNSAYIGTIAANSSSYTTSIVNGLAGSMPYQSAPSVTSFVTIGSANYVMTSNGSAPQWTNPTSMTVGTANNTTYVNGKTESNLNVNSASYANASVTNTFTVGTGTYFVSNGNVGIGTSSPGYPLHIPASGTASFIGGILVGTNGTDVKSSVGELSLQSNGANPITIWTNSASRVYVAANGNVGIANSTPAHKLRVEGTTSLAGAVSGITTLAAGNTTITGFANVSGDGQFTGNVGIGVAPNSLVGLNILKTWASDANPSGMSTAVIDSNTSMTAARTKYNTISGLFNYNQNKSSDGLTTYATNYYGIYNYMYNGNASTGGDASAGSMTGTLNHIINTANGANANTLTTARSGYNIVQQSGTSTITTAEGTRSRVQIGNSTITGNITSAFAYVGDIIPGSAATIDTGYIYYGSYGAGTVTTKYGAYISGESYNYFSGNMGIGNTTPAHKLRVTGTTSLAGAVSDITTLAAGNTTFSGWVNVTSSSVTANGATFTYANVTGQVNTATLYVTTSANIGTAVIANSVGLTTTGFVNVSGTGFFGNTVQLRGYTGGTVGSLVSSHIKTLQIGGAYNQSYNSGNAAILHIADYGNDTGDDVYPIYVEDENNYVDFYLWAGNNNLSSSKRAYFGGSVGIGNTAPTDKLSVNGTTNLGGNTTISGFVNVATTLAAGNTTLTGTLSVSQNTTFSNGVNFGSAVAASSTDTARHIALWGTSYGFNVTGATLNYTVPASASHVFNCNGIETLETNATGLYVGTRFLANSTHANATHLNGIASTSYARTDVADAFDGIVTFNANAVLTKSLSANGGFGTAGQYLKSGAAANTYWGNITSADVTTALGYTPGTGDITGVTASTGLSGGGTSGSVTLSIDSTVLTTSATAQSKSGLMTVGGLAAGTATATSTEIRAQGDIIAFSSDSRLKTDVKQISDALDKVKKITGITYNHNELAVSFGFSDKHRLVGVLAQEIEAVLPEAVTLAPFDAILDEDENFISRSGENYKTVKYDKLVSLLIEAIKELSYEVDELKTEIKGLKK